MRVVLSSSAAARLDAARRFVLEAPPDSEHLIVAASRGAADDFARALGMARGATFGMHRFSVTQLAARLASPQLAKGRVTPTSPLGVEAVAARALFDASRDRALSYFARVTGFPGFPRALARTLEEVALAKVSAADVAGTGDGGADLAALMDRVDWQFETASAVDRSRFFAAALQGVTSPGNPYARCRLLLIDVPIASATEKAFIEALANRAPGWCVTTPKGDEVSRQAFAGFARAEMVEEGDEGGGGGGLDRLRRYLFLPATPPPGQPLREVELFSAPGEGRECVEIARRVLREARTGVAFDRIAIALRAPRQYAGLLEHALERAGVPAYFERGTRRPHPAGRAFLALLRCAADRLSARRFAEYLSLGQIPDAPISTADAFPVSSDEVFVTAASRASSDSENERERVQPELDEGAVAGRMLRMPWKWERLLVESRVVATAERWERRLFGLVNECELQKRELARTEPDSSRIDRLTRKIEDIRQLAAFALPIVRTLGSWPARATWGEWIERFEALASQALRRPDRVLRVLADLRPMGAIGPIGLDEASVVLADRLASIEAEAPARRYGRVLVTTPGQLRARTFHVVFVPGLAERLFPQRPREDPLLLDDARGRIAGRGGPALITQPLRAEEEKLQLRLAAGAAESRLYVSFPTVEVADGRPRVPSLYALEVWRAMTGHVPGADELQQLAARASHATLAWPAPTDREEAIDPLEHDLSTLRSLVAEPDSRVRGRAQYMLHLNACVHRSVRERYMRRKSAWSHWDGIAAVTERLEPVLDAHRLGARAYSLSALQKYSACPYQFFLSAICRMRPADDLEPLQRMDPLTKGSLFHAVQTDFYRRLKRLGELPVRAANRDRALLVLDEALAETAAQAHEELAPAVDKVWHDEIAAIRRDLRLWVDEIAGELEWCPKWFEWSFGLSDPGRDEASAPGDALIDGRFRLHGSIDLVEERANGDLRVTDHKTGKYRGKENMVVDGGAALQPVLYSLALEAATGRSVVEGRLYYATTEGGYRTVPIALTPQARRVGVEVLEILDRAIERGFLAPAPRDKACSWCDFRTVCGPAAEHRVNFYKSREPLSDLVELRRKP